MARCDLCEKYCAKDSLRSLRECYQIPNVVDICPDCLKWVDKRLEKIRERISEEIKADLHTRKTGLQVLQKPSFFDLFSILWQRFPHD